MNWLLRSGAGNVSCGTCSYPGLSGSWAGVGAGRDLAARDAAAPESFGWLQPFCSWWLF